MTGIDEAHASLFNLREELERKEDLVSDKKQQVESREEHLERLHETFKTQKEVQGNISALLNFLIFNIELNGRDKAS